MPSKYSNPKSNEYRIIAEAIVKARNGKNGYINCASIAKELNVFRYAVVRVFSHMLKTGVAPVDPPDDKVPEEELIKDEAQGISPDMKGGNLKDLVLFEDEGPTLVRTKKGAII